MQCLLGPLIDILNGPSGLQRRDHRDRVTRRPSGKGQRSAMRDLSRGYATRSARRRRAPGGVIAFAIRRKARGRSRRSGHSRQRYRGGRHRADRRDGISDNQIHLLLSSHGKALASLDDLVGAASRFGGISSTSVFAVLRLMTSSSFVGWLDRQIAGFGALEDLVDHAGRPIVQIGVARP